MGGSKDPCHFPNGVTGRGHVLHPDKIWICTMTVVAENVATTKYFAAACTQTLYGYGLCNDPIFQALKFQAGFFKAQGPHYNWRTFIIRVSHWPQGLFSIFIYLKNQLHGSHQFEWDGCTIWWCRQRRPGLFHFSGRMWKKITLFVARIIYSPSGGFNTINSMTASQG